MTAEVIPFIRLSHAGRVNTIERLAHDDRMPDAEKATELREVAHQSLTGLRLWLAWQAAEDAILIRDWTKPQDADYEGCKDQADITTAALLYGTRGDAA